MSTAHHQQETNMKTKTTLAEKTSPIPCTIVVEPSEIDKIVSTLQRMVAWPKLVSLLPMAGDQVLARDVDLCALRHVPTTCVHDLAGRLVCQKVQEAGKRPAATLLQLAPRSRQPPPEN